MKSFCPFLLFGVVVLATGCRSGVEAGRDDFVFSEVVYEPGSSPRIPGYNSRFRISREDFEIARYRIVADHSFSQKIQKAQAFSGSDDSIYENHRVHVFETEELSDGFPRWVVHVHSREKPCEYCLKSPVSQFAASR